MSRVAVAVVLALAACTSSPPKWTAYGLTVEPRPNMFIVD